MTGSDRDEFSAQVARTADWLAGMPIQRLEREQRESELLSSAHELCVRIIEFQCQVDPLAYGPTGVPRVPSVQPVAAGSQLRVVAGELLATLSGTPVQNAATAAALQELSHEVRDLRVGAAK